MQRHPELPWELSVKLAEPPGDRVEHAVEAGSPADGARLETSRSAAEPGSRSSFAAQAPSRDAPTSHSAQAMSSVLLGIDDESRLADAFSGTC